MSQQCFFRFSFIVFMGFRWCFFCFFVGKGGFFGACKALLRGIKVLFGVFLVV